MFSGLVLLARLLKVIHWLCHIADNLLCFSGFCSWSDCGNPKQRFCLWGFLGEPAGCLLGFAAAEHLHLTRLCHALVKSPWWSLCTSSLSVQKEYIVVEKWGYFNPVFRYSGGFDAQKGFSAPIQQSWHGFLLYFWISVVSPCYQMSKPLQPKLVLILLIVQKLGVKSLLVSWTRLQERD